MKLDFIHATYPRNQLLRPPCGKIRMWLVIHAPWLTVIAVTLGVCIWSHFHVARIRQRDERAFDRAEARVWEVAYKLQTELQDIRNRMKQIESRLLDARLVTTSRQLSLGYFLAHHREIERRLGLVGRTWNELEKMQSGLNDLALRTARPVSSDLGVLVEDLRASVSRVTGDFTEITTELNHTVELHCRLVQLEQEQPDNVGFSCTPATHDQTPATSMEVAGPEQPPTTPGPSPVRDWESVQAATALAPRSISDVEPCKNRCMQEHAASSRTGDETTQWAQAPVIVLCPGIPLTDLIGFSRTRARHVQGLSPQQRFYFAASPGRFSGTKSFPLTPVPTFFCGPVLLVPSMGAYVLVPGDLLFTTQEKTTGRSTGNATHKLRQIPRTSRVLRTLPEGI
ncbi:MAG: hypothetical protein N3G20_08685 [Verrucomicrobiae bacterium]|nr:hypothetical protein [Verrucomicrobiae bacterium]